MSTQTIVTLTAVVILLLLLFFLRNRRKSQPAAKRFAPPRREDVFKSAFDHSPVGMAFVSPTGQWLQFNRRLTTILGYSREDLARTSMREMTHVDDRRVEATQIRKMLAGEQAGFSMLKRMARRGGRYVTYRTSVGLVKKPTGEVDYLNYIIEEVGDQVPAAEEMPPQAAFMERLEETRRESEKIREESQSRIAELESARQAAQSRLDEYRAAYEKVRSGSEEKISELRKTVESLKRELSKKEGVEQSLREALDQLRYTDEELMNELKIITDALRKEMDRRKEAEGSVHDLQEELARSSAEWDERLKAAAQTHDEAPVPDEVATAPAPPQPEWSNLENTPPAELFAGISREQRSGMLRVAHDGLERKIFFDRGRIYSASSNQPDLFLAELLLERGHITAEQRQRALEVQQETGIALGRILLIMDVVTEEQLMEAMRYKVEEEVLRIFRAPAGNFVFVNENARALQLVPLRIDVAPLISLALHGKREEVQSAPIEQEPAAEEDETQRFLFVEGADVSMAESAGGETSSTVSSTAVLAPVEEELAPAAEASHTAAEAAPDIETASPAIVHEPEAAREEAPPASDGETASSEAATADTVVASRSAKGKSKKYHRETCTTAKKMSENARMTFASPAEAEAQGFERCKVCFRG